MNYFNWQDPEKGAYLDWNDPDLVDITDGLLPYSNPDLDLEYGPEQRTIAGGGQEKGVMEKCTFCVHRVEQGLGPKCAEVCPTRVIHFGDLDDPLSEVSRLLKENPSFRLLEDAGTQPNVYYIGGQPPTGETRQIEEVKAKVG